MKRALILIDIQNDFLPGGALAVPGGDQMIPIANRLMPLFHLVVATQDWHPSDHGSFAVNHPGGKPFARILLEGLPQTLWPVHCVQNTEGAAFASSLDTGGIARVIQKGTDRLIDSYSGFFDNNHRKSTGLGEYLRAKSVSELFILGLATDYCVKATALDARELGFDVRLIADGCRGVNLAQDDVDKALVDMRAAGVMQVQSAGIVGEVEGRP